MNYSLRTKLSLSYILLGLILVAGISILSNFLLEKQFRDYIIREQEQKNKEYVNLISRQYNTANSSWGKGVVENIGLNALEQGVIVKVKDAAGKIVWDATTHNSGFCVQMINHMSKNMFSRYPDFKGGYVEKSYPITHNFSNVRSVEIGYYGPFYLTDNDLVFISTLNKMLISIAMFALILALFLGTIMAKHLSAPISRVINSTQQIAKGYFDDRINGKSNTREINQLTSAINDLADILQKQERLRKQLTSDVAHELRTPLATLQSHMEAMIDGIWDTDVERLKSCHDEILRIGRMVQEMEKLAKYDSENLILNKSKFQFFELVQHIVRNFETEFVNRGVEIYLNGNQVEINADRDKISQVVVNLISNALKYTNQDGKVDISVKDIGDEVEFGIKDTGVGISEQDLPYIFERFYRADKSRNRLSGGSGIGLAIVKAIVRAHKGRIKVISEVNKSSEFIVLLPKQAN
jgi:signal transduction histidine kinase